jgi:predicted ATPase/DNA-binding winged helix-turn-helix (wHTH) protein
MLLHGDRPVHIGSRALDLLHALVQRPGDVITKDELIKAAWPNTFVHESNLKVNIATLRRALTQMDSDQSYIATVPGRGYRFVAPLRIPAGSMELAVADSTIGGSGTLPSLSTIIGRDGVIAELAGAIECTRLLTIVGPAGVGKTTVAVAAAQRIAANFSDGVIFVDLTTLGDLQLVAPAIAFSLGVDGNLVNMLPRLVEAMRDRRILLVLDNCEHVLSAAASIAEHLQLMLPELRIIATSREPLRSRLEAVHRLVPLECPPAGGGDIDAVAAMRFPATELLVTRAMAHGYQLTKSDVPAIVAICRRLDGIALAIELAAPRLGENGPAALLRILQHSFAALAADGDRLPLRHRTLMTTLDWSYRLLSGDEAWLLRRLSLFGGTFTLDDVAGTMASSGRAIEDIARWLEGLAAKSLLSVSYRAGGPRYRLLDSTRSFAAERLRGAGEQDAAMLGHARYLLHLFEQAEAEWHWRTRTDWTARYGHWANDLRRAIKWTFDKGHPQLGVRLTAAAIPFWQEFSSFGESRVRVQTAIGAIATSPNCDPKLEMKLAAALGINLMHSAKLHEAEMAWTEVLRLANALEDVEYSIRALWGLAAVQLFSGRHRESLLNIARFIEVIKRRSDGSALPDAERIRLMETFHCADIVGALAGLERLADENVSVRNSSRISRFAVDRSVGIRYTLAFVAWVAGDQCRALEVAEEAVSTATAIGHPVSIAAALGLAAIPLAVWSGSFETAQRRITMLHEKAAIFELDTWASFTHFYQAALDSAQGDPAGIDRMRIATREFIAANNMIRLPIHLAMLAHEALRHRRSEVAHKSIRSAFRHAARNNETWCRAELLHVRGLVEWKTGNVAQAEQTLMQATRVAGQSGALTFHLRAAVSLARLWQEKGRANAALALLASVYGRFDPSLGTADLVAAGDLLESLGTELGKRGDERTGTNRWRGSGDRSVAAEA